jgi:hypothetical protein
MEQLPLYISVTFILTTVLTVFFMYQATGKSKIFLGIITSWLLLQLILSVNGFYNTRYTIPPRLTFAVVPPFLLTFTILLSRKGRQYLDTLQLSKLTLLHSVRIPVELVLYWLYLYQAVPGLMTFEGSNPDILSGISALFIYYFIFIKRKNSPTLLLVWNFIGLALLINIVIHAVLSAPSPFQQLAFEQPNVAVFYFPFIWLPSCVVPLVLFSHLASIRQLLVMRQKEKSQLTETTIKLKPSLEEMQFRSAKIM